MVLKTNERYGTVYVIKSSILAPIKYKVLNFIFKKITQHLKIRI